MKEGLRRTVKTISVIAWVCLVVGLVLGVAALFGREPAGFVVLGGFGFVVFALLQGLAWILAGFSGNPKTQDGLVRWGDLWSWRRVRKQHMGAMTHNPGPTGVGGWLLLLVINLIVLSPLRAIAEMTTAISDTEKAYPALMSLQAWVNYKTVIWTIVIALLILSVIAGLKLKNKHEPNSVVFASWAIWIAGPLSFIPVFAANMIVLKQTLNELVSDPATIREFFISLVVATIWSLYLKWSRRVRNTYYNRLYPTGPSLIATAVRERQDPTL